MLHSIMRITDGAYVVFSLSKKLRQKNALKNQFEEFRNDQSIKDKKFSDYITEEFKNDQSKD